MNAIIFVLVCYVYIPDGTEECTLVDTNYSVEAYCERAHEVELLFDDIEIVSCVEQKDEDND